MLVVGAELGDGPLPQPGGRRVDDGVADRHDRRCLGPHEDGRELRGGQGGESGQQTREGAEQLAPTQVVGRLGHTTSSTPTMASNRPTQDFRKVTTWRGSWWWGRGWPD